MDSPQRPIPLPVQPPGDGPTRRSRSTRRVGRARALIVGGAVVSSLVGTGALVATATATATASGTTTSTSSSQSSTGSQAPTTLLTTGSGTTTHATSGGS